jgi:hypothetical protein
MNNQLEEIIKTALEKDVDKSEEEYADARSNASKEAERTTGIPAQEESEEIRHARIQSNFYGTALNFFLAFQDHLAETREINARIEQKLDLTNALLVAIAEANGIQIVKGDGGGENNAE